MAVERPHRRKREKKAEVILLSKYGKTVIDQRILRPRTRIEYEPKWSQLIEPKLGKLAVRDLTTTAVRAWFSGLGDEHPTRNGHAYGILSMIFNTAVRDRFVGTQPGMRFGEVTELRRKDFDSDCTVVTISRAVTHRADPNTPRR